MSGISAAATVSPAGANACADADVEAARTAEAARIALLVARDGEAEALAWVKRTLAIYRRAIFDPGHFASFPHYRRKFLASCAVFRRWLAARKGNGP